MDVLRLALQSIGLKLEVWIVAKGIDKKIQYKLCIYHNLEVIFAIGLLIGYHYVIYIILGIYLIV